MQTERDLSTRLRVASYLDRTSLGIYLELIQAALSILSCCLYIAETYYEKIPQWMNILDILLCVIFLSDFILHVYLAEKKYQYVFSRYGMIDLLTVLPVLIGIGVTGLNSYRHLFFFLRPARVLRSVRILRFLPAATKSTAARRQMIFLVYSGVCLVFIFSGLFQYVENNSVLGSDITRNGIEHPFLPFHEAVYFMVILAYTVSFGDPIPSNWVGKLVTMSYIIVTALVIPLQIRKLIKILAMQKDGGWVARSKKRPHYIVTGSVHPTNFANFLSDFFDTRQKHDRARIVVLSGAEATDDFDMIHLPYIENKIHWLLGSVLVPIDLKRSQTASASGAFIFANSTAADPNREDKLNILRALSLRKHNRSMPVSVQLIDSSWKAHVQENTIIPFALDEVKMNLLVWSTIYPGFSTLISNMLMWRLQIPLPLNPPEWLKEYAIGLNQTLVEIEIPHKYLSETFTAVVVDVYNQYGITVVGVRKSGATKVILAPLNIDLRMSVGDTFVLLADVTQLQQFADRRFLKDLLAPPKERTKLDGIPLLGKIARKNSEFLDSLRLDVEIDSTEAEEESMAVGEDRDMFFHEHFDQGNTPRKPRRRFPFLKSKTVAAINDIPRNASRHFMLMDLAGLAPTKLPTATPEIVHTRSLAECTITSLDPAVTQHIVLCGCPRSRFGLYHFMQPLMLPVKIGESQEPPLVVILSQDPPAPATWAEVAHMNNILYINGSGMKSEDLFAAGIERARSIVILSSSAISTPSVITRSKHGVSTIAEAADMVYSQDADVILTTRAIHSTLHTMKSDSVFTISEMVHTKTFNLLALHEGDDTEFFLSPGFASGYFYDAGITERLIYQCHEKKFLKDIFSKIFSTKHKKRSTFISQISVPEIEPLTYGNLFSWAVRRNMIPVGLYRPMGEDMGQGSDHFVTVNPPANTILSERDRIFVWCSVLNNKNYK